MNNLEKFMAGNYVNDKQMEETNERMAMKRQIGVRPHRLRGTINFRVCHHAMDELSNGAYKLYMYMLLMNEDECQYYKGWTLMEKVFTGDASEMTGYLDEMVQKGYLTETENPESVKKNVVAFYDLWEDPEMAEAHKSQQEPRTQVAR